MANLDPLIRFQKFKMDERQRFIARLYAEAENIYNHKKRMLGEVARERKFADESMNPWVITGFLGYQGLMKKRVALINREIERIEARIDIAREELRTEFIELKKFEIVNRRRLERRRKILDRLESQMFDAIAIEGFRRRLEEEGLESALATV